MNVRTARLVGVALLLVVLVFIPRGPKESRFPLPTDEALPGSISGDVVPEDNRHIAAGGTLMFVRPDDFGLAALPEQILLRSVIPPCDHDFDYCLYYIAPTFEGTTFRSAGVRIKERKDLDSRLRCLLTPPAGYATFEPIVRDGQGYRISTFAPVQDAGMGHFAEGVLFRLHLELDTACYEVETRIAQSQISHYPPGAIDPFTLDDEAFLRSRLEDVLASIRLVRRPSVRLFSLQP